MTRSIWLMAFLSVIGIFVLSGTASPITDTGKSPSDTRRHQMESLPALPAGAQIAMIYGNPTEPELYVMLLKFPPNYKNPPHSHPVEQVADCALRDGLLRVWRKLRS